MKCDVDIKWVTVKGALMLTVNNAPVARIDKLGNRWGLMYLIKNENEYSVRRAKKLKTVIRHAEKRFGFKFPYWHQPTTKGEK